MERLFIALPMPGEVKKTLSAVYDSLVPWKKQLRRVHPENYHVTISFLGECDEELKTQVKNEFNAISVPDSPIPFRIEGMGAFPNLKRPNVIWCGVDTDLWAVSMLANTVRDKMELCGFERDRKRFVPHLTVARVKKANDLDNKILELFDEQKAAYYTEGIFDRLTLYSSTLTPGGPVYEVIAEKLFQ
ncbi:MAG TPA: RNA 2',3'-cyclic phosphodiesterase [Spirochaetota bacterium]|nr:RNA 2',3'-cyclic phosphodiesterase [Spirochaetota bacterium]HPJ38524.1 RNA 2',3'-cyclic phosphodiesterase [Spirochaetota bacterium]HPQ53737.1 RNA 2',3'-cyclic phosphodiesterase [Spirochaetota bacterium]